MTEPQSHLEYLRALKDELNDIHGRSVTATRDTEPRNDSAEAIAAALRRRKIVRER